MHHVKQINIKIMTYVVSFRETPVSGKRRKYYFTDNYLALRFLVVAAEQDLNPKMTVILKHQKTLKNTL